MKILNLAGRAVLVAGLAVTVAIGAADAGTMSPHRATYALSAAPGAGQKMARVIDGLMISELSDDCDGHTLTERMVILLSQGEGRDFTLDSQYNAWESKDGLSFRFLTSNRLNGGEVEVIRGSAKLDATGGPGLATFTSPEAKEMKLPPGTRFPVHAGAYSLAMAESGERQLTTIFFDGSSVDGAYIASGFVIDGPIKIAKPPTGDLDLLDTPSWHTRTAIFDLNSEASSPASEIDGQTHANGIVSGFTLEAGAFDALATLTNVEALPDSGC